MVLTFLVMPLIGESQFILSTKVESNNIPTVQPYVAYNPDGDKHFFTSFEDALEITNAMPANSPRILYILPGSRFTIHKSMTIKKHVSVQMPYEVVRNPNNNLLDFKFSRPNHEEKITNDKTTIYGPIDRDEEYIKKFLVTSVTLDDDVILTIEGEWEFNNSPHGQLVVGAEYGEQGVNGRYCQILLSRGAQIRNMGLLDVYGCIKNVQYEVMSDGDRPNRVNHEVRGIYCANGYLNTLMAVYDLPGSGSPLDDLLADQICPFTQYDFPNLQTRTKITSHANFAPFLSIYRTILNTAVTMNNKIDIVNSDISKNALFKFRDGSGESRENFAVVLDYKRKENDPNRMGNYSYYSANENVHTEIQIYGPASVGTIKFLAANTYDIDTANYFLPFSQRVQLHVMKNANFYIDYKIKFLPGSVFKVNLGASVKLSNEMIFYKKEHVKLLSDFSYPSNFNDAYGIVNGWLIMLKDKNALTHTKLGGKLITQNETGQANLNCKEITDKDAFIVKAEEGRYSRWGGIDYTTTYIEINMATVQLEGLTYRSSSSGTTQSGSNQCVCHFLPGKIYKSKATQRPDQIGWDLSASGSYGAPIIPNKLSFQIEKVAFEPSIFAFDLFIKQSGSATEYMIAGQVNKGNKFDFYIDADAQIRMFLKSTRTYWGINNFVMTNNVPFQISKDEKISITPAKAKYLFISESSYTRNDDYMSSFSGRGTIQTLIMETLSGKPEHLYVVAALGSGVGKVTENREKYVTSTDVVKYRLKSYTYDMTTAFKVAADAAIRLKTDLGHWSFVRDETNKIYDQIYYQNLNNDLRNPVPFHEDWLIGTKTDIHLVRRGGSRRG